MDLLTTVNELGADGLRARGSLKWTTHPPDVHGAFVGEMDFGTAPVVTESLARAVSAGWLGYTPPWMVQDLIESCAAWMATRYDWTIDPDAVHAVPDVLRALEFTIEHLTPPGSAVVLPTPAYMPFLTVPARLNRRVIQVPMIDVGGHYSLDLEALDHAFRAGGGLLVICTPHNPTGGVLERAEMLAVADLVERHGARVFSDEIHAPLVYDGIHVPYASVSAAAAAHTVTATSASKGWNVPGLKCAQAILTNPDDRPRWRALGDATTAGASSLGMVANTAAYAEGAPWLERVVGYLRSNRDTLVDLVAEHLPDVSFRAPAATYLAWLDLRDTCLGSTVTADLLRERGRIAVTDGAACGTVGRGFVRLNFATPRSVLEEDVRRIALALDASRPSRPGSADPMGTR
jgi:cystathionine beta-lyase